MAKQKITKIPRPHTRVHKLQCRVSNEQMQALITKAHTYFNGVMSDLLLNAALEYRPVRKSEGRKV